MIDRWREVYEREYPHLLRAPLAIGRDPVAEDAAQEAFVGAHQTGLDTIEKLPTWLLVVGVGALPEALPVEMREGSLGPRCR